MRNLRRLETGGCWEITIKEGSQSPNNNETSQQEKCPRNKECPLCRQKTVTVLAIEDDLHRAAYNIVRAIRFKCPKESERSHWFRDLIRELTETFAAHYDNMWVLCIKAQFVMHVSPKRAVPIIESMINIDSVHSNLHQSVNMFRGTSLLSETAANTCEDALLDLENIFGLGKQVANPTTLHGVERDPRRLYPIDLLMAEALEGCKDWNSAGIQYEKMLVVVNHCKGNADIHRISEVDLLQL